MIIAFSGRKSSGKTTLSNYLVKKGFEKISFATELKILVSKLYDIPINDLSDTSKKEMVLENPLIWDENKASQLSVLINATKKLNSVEKKFISIREALQYIGTEVLRKYDNDFHVKSIRKYIDPKKNYTLDDVRFKNELNLLKDMGSICIYLFRPFYFDQYNNHLSEIELNRNDFDYVIINSRNEKFLLKQFCRFEKQILRKFSVKTAKKYMIREELIELLKTKSTTEISKKFGCSRDAIVWWCNLHLIPITRNNYNLNQNSFLIPNKESAYWAGLLSADGCIKAARKTYANRNNYLLELASNDKELIDGFTKFLKTDKKPYEKKSKINGKTSYLLTINSPFIVEDMKLWNIEPRKSRYNKIPDILKEKDDLFKYWLVGLIDGDGSICIINHKKYNYKNIIISFLASGEIVEYVKQKYPEINCSVSKAKNVKNLFDMRYSGKFAVMLYNTIYRGIGLKRKWSKVNPYLGKKWYC